MSKLEILQRVSLAVAALALILGFASASGCAMGEAPPPSWGWPLHALLVLLGVGGGLAAMLRGIEADRERWRVLQDDLLTKGEREYAHKHAERKRRGAGTAFLLAPVAVGYFLANFFSTEEPNLVTDSLVITPLFSFLIGVFLGRYRENKEAKPDF